MFYLEYKTNDWKLFKIEMTNYVIITLMFEKIYLFYTFVIETHTHYVHKINLYLDYKCQHESKNSHQSGNKMSITRYYNI